MHFNLQKAVECQFKETFQTFIMIIICICICPLSGAAYKFEYNEMDNSMSALTSSASLSSAASASAEISTDLLEEQNSKTHSTHTSPTISPASIDIDAIKLSSTLSTYDLIYSADYFYDATPISLETLVPTKSSVQNSGTLSLLKSPMSFYTQLPASLEKLKFTQQQQQKTSASSLLALSLSSLADSTNVEIPNDSNEINGQNYFMTKHIASHDEKEIEASHSSTFVRANESTLDQTRKQEQKEYIFQAHTYTNALRSSAHTQQPHNSYGRLNKSQDLSSLSLLSFNDADSEMTASLQKRLAEKQQKQQQQSLSTSSINNDNNINMGSKNNVEPSENKYMGNGTTTNFQHIGSQRIMLKSPITTANGKATAATNATVNNSNTTASSGSSKTSNTKTATGQIISSIRTNMPGRKVESKYILPKPQKTDAPMLNYIFDTFSSANKHHHHDQRYGPHFEDVERLGQPTNITVQAGSSIHLNCRISLLQDKTVSWVRRNVQGEHALDLLTVGQHTYTGDKRYKLEFQYPNNWRLKIINVKKDDEATYECQISTHPPRVIQINLLVNAPKVMIVDEFCDPLQEKYYEIDSTLQLSCVVRNVAMTTSVVYWKHGDDVLNYDVTRGGVSVKTELMDDGANSTLSIAKISKADSGNYTCSINEFQNFTIIVHILNGESFAELHHGGAAAISLRLYHHTLTINLILLILLLCLPATYIQR